MLRQGRSLVQNDTHSLTDIPAERQPDGNALAMADEAGGVAVWRDPVPQDYIGPADNPDVVHAARSAPEAPSADDAAENTAAQGDSLDDSPGDLGELAAELKPQAGHDPDPHAAVRSRNY